MGALVRPAVAVPTRRRREHEAVHGEGADGSTGLLSAGWLGGSILRQQPPPLAFD